MFSCSCSVKLNSLSISQEQVNSYCINGEDNDTDALIESEPDQQNGSCEQTSETDR